MRRLFIVTFFMILADAIKWEGLVVWLDERSSKLYESEMAKLKKENK